MNSVEVIVRILFVLLAIYTIFFLVQWVVGLFVSMEHLRNYKERCSTYDAIYPTELAKKYPISIIIPAHNESSCIKDTIASLLENSYPNLHVIVVDDGSTDQTVQTVIEKFSLVEQEVCIHQQLHTQPVKKVYGTQIEDTSITLVMKENGGKADALNCGLNMCHTPYCVIVDADTKVEEGALHYMATQFLLDSKVIVCAGLVSNQIYKTQKYKALNIFQRQLVIFQKLEYYRTFYLQRILFDRLNANMIVSGAFAMFKTEMLKNIGGYHTSTIGEDMEMTMRLHAFCHSLKRNYRIAYIPEARCYTQLPFTYRDYYNQRRRWHIGMIQSLKHHFYMLGNYHYGMAGFMSGIFIMWYELIAPFVEIIGVVSLFLAWYLDLLNPSITMNIIVFSLLLNALNQYVLIHGLKKFGIENLSISLEIKLFLTSMLEWIFFHPYNVVIKLIAFFTRKRNKMSWKHITREMDA